MNTNAITLITPDTYSTFDKMAKDVVASGFSKLTEFQIKFIFFKGLELGVSPLQALDGINNIQGKPTCSPQFMLALIERSGQVEDIAIDSTDQRCIVTMKRKGRSPHTETFTLQDARAMGLDSKDNYKKQPKTMMKWRAVAACARVVYPDVIQGLYTAEEMGADVTVTEDGDMVVISKPVEPPAAQIPATVEPPIVTSTPANVESPTTSVYGDLPPFGWPDNEVTLFWKQSLDFYPHKEHGRNSINKMRRAGQLAGKTMVEALDIVRKHVEASKEGVGA